MQIEALKARDPEFLAQLFTQVNPVLLRMAGSRGFFKDAAEELVHQTWETFFVNLDQFQGKSQIRTFLIGILLNKIREDGRKTARVDLEEDSDKVFDRSFTVGGWWSKDPAAPDQLLENKQLGNLIEDCLEGLTEQQRSAFVLIEVDGEESSEACNILGITSTHLRVLIFRAKDKLRLCLEGQSAS